MIELVAIVACAAAAVIVIGAVLKIEAEGPAPKPVSLPAICYQEA